MAVLNLRLLLATLVAVWRRRRRRQKMSNQKKRINCDLSHANFHRNRVNFTISANSPWPWDVILKIYFKK